MGKRIVLIIFLALAVSGCGATTAASTTAMAASKPTATAGQKPTATLNTGGQAVLGGSVTAFKKVYQVNPSCTESAVCFCASTGNSACDYMLAVRAVNGTVSVVTLRTTETWALDFTLTFCAQYLPEGATISSTTGGVTQSGTYNYQSSAGQVVMQISPGTCQLSLANV